jgi:hypothetical protein
VNLLRRVLYLNAGVWALTGILLCVAPVPVLEDVFDQVSLPEYAWVRMTGILAIGAAMLMVLVAHRIESIWWFAWAFVLTEGALAVLAALNALFGLPDGSGALLWWLLAGVSAAFAAGMLLGLATTGLERPAE